MDRWVAFALTLTVGALVAFQPPSNALLGRHTGPLAAATFSLALSTVLVTAVALAAGELGGLSELSHLRPVHLLGGIGGAAIVAITTYTVRPLGAGGTAAALVCTQLLASLVIDRYALLDVTGHVPSARQLAGAALLIAGTLLVTLR